MARKYCTRCGWKARYAGDLSRTRGLCAHCQAFRVIDEILGAQELPPGYYMANGQASREDLMRAVENDRMIILGW